MRTLLIVLAAGTILGGCATQSANIPPPPVEAAEAPPPVAPAPKPQIGTFGFDTAGMDTTVAPGDNFYQYANGTWAKNTPIPADKSNYGMFTLLDDLSKERTRTIIEESAKDPNSKIGAAYASYLDEAAVEAKGLALCELFIRLVETRCAGHGLLLTGPGEMNARGLHVSFAHPEGYAIVQALIARGVVGDFRDPDILRFGFSPLFLGHVDVVDAVEVLRDVLEARAWDRPEFRARAAVT